MFRRPKLLLFLSLANDLISFASIHYKSFLKSVIATIFQGTTLVCLMGIIGSFLVVLFGSTSAALTAANFFLSVTVYLLATMMVLHLTDICFTPISFTVLGTLPLQVVLISLFAISRKFGFCFNV